MNPSCRVFGAVILALGLSLPGALSFGATRYVWNESPAPAPPYSQWAHAAHDIQSAVEASEAGDVVLVTNGTYATSGAVTPGHALSNRVVLNKAITLQSVNGPEVTLIQGQGPAGSNAVRCVYLTNGVLLAGFTLSGGYTMTNGHAHYDRRAGGVFMDQGGTVSNCIVRANRASVRAGGIYGYTNGVVIDSTIQENVANQAAGLYLVGGGEVARCSILNNSASDNGGGCVFYDYGTIHDSIVRGNKSGNDGAGIAFWTSNTGVVERCEITFNWADASGGGVQLHKGDILANSLVSSNMAMAGNGGGVWMRGEGLATNCVFTGNTAHYGGAIQFDANGQALHCVIQGNQARYDGGGIEFGVQGLAANCTLRENWADCWGGGAALWGGATLQNCAIFNNRSGMSGGGLGLWQTNTVRNCTITRNQALQTGSGVSLMDRGQVLENCIIWDNEGDSPLGIQPWEQGLALSINRFNCIQGWTGGGEGNISLNPQLIDAFHLAPTSPCLGAGLAAVASGMDLDGEAWDNPPPIGCDEVAGAPLTDELKVNIVAAATNFATQYPCRLAADITGRISRLSWDLGDGSHPQTPVVTRAWSAGGDYPVVLTAYNEAHPAGVSASMTVHVVTNAVTHVNLANPNPQPPYNSWPTAATNIQDAVNASIAGGTVLVTNGLYTFGSYYSDSLGESIGLPSRLVITNDILVRSVNGPELTRIQGQGSWNGTQITNGPGAVRCVFMRAGQLSGFTLTGGHTLTNGDWSELSQSGGGIYSLGGIVTNCNISGNAAVEYGGGAVAGVLIDCIIRSNCTVNAGSGAYYSVLRHCTLQDNYGSGWAGGAHNCLAYDSLFSGNRSSVGAGAAYSTLVNCEVRGNNAQSGGGGAYLTATECTFKDNRASDAGGGTYISSLINCVMTGNSAGGGGGAAWGGSLTRCTLVSNIATNDGGGASAASLFNSLVISNTVISSSGKGGGIVLSRGSIVRNCLVAGNRAALGGGLYFWEDYPAVNCTVVGNQSPDGSGVRAAGGGQLENSIVWGNTGSANVVANLTTNHYNCLADWTGGGDGIITANPLFFDPVSGDYSLRPGSPCINSGLNQDWMVGATDLRGGPRITDSKVDLGADEIGPLACVFSADRSQGINGLTNVLFTALTAGTNITGLYYRWDLNGDGSVDAEGYGLNQTRFNYPITGVYSVSLVVSNQVGETARFDQARYVGVYPPLQADFTALPRIGAAPETVQFTDTTLNKPQFWAWDFNGDGIIDSTNQNPSWVYTNMGTYTVTLTVSNNFGTDGSSAATCVKTNYIQIPVTAGIESWDLANDFMTLETYDLATNPNGAWSYGGKTYDDKGLPTVNFQFGTQFRQGTTIVGYSGNCNVWKNYGGGAYGIPPGGVSVNCDANLTSTVRWTAPEPGVYDVTGAYGVGDGNWAKGNRSVFLNTTELWRSSSAAGSFSFTNLALANGDSIDFTIWGYSGGYGNTPVSATITTKRRGPPVIKVQPRSQTVYILRNTSLSVIASGGGPLSYQWRKEGTRLSEATNATLAFANVQLADTGDYDVIVTNPLGSVTSGVARLEVSTCFTPLAGIVGWWPGDARGLDLSPYRNNGALMGGVTVAPGLVGPAFDLNGTNQFVEVPANPAFDFTNNFTIALWFYQRSSIGNGYRLVDRCTAGFPDGFTFDTWPGSQLRFVAQAEVRANTSHSLNAWHHAAVTFQNSTATLYLDGQPVGSASGILVGLPKDISLRIGAAHLGCDGTCGLVEYFDGRLDEVILFNRALAPGEITALYTSRELGMCSNVPLISADQTVLPGETATFSVGAIEMPLAYQWRKDGANLNNATNITLSVTNAQLPDAGNYDVVIAHAQGSVTSRVARLTVNVFARQPESQRALPGAMVSFSVRLGNLPPPVSFQWLFNGTKLADSGRISGATSPTLTLANIQPGDAGRYSVVVSNFQGSATSSVATLSLGSIVAYYNFEEAAGAGAVASIHDAGPNHLDGTVHPPLIYSADVPQTDISDHWSIDARSDTYNYGNIPHDNRFNLDEFTLECFMKGYPLQPVTGDPGSWYVQKEWTTGWGNFLQTYALGLFDGGSQPGGYIVGQVSKGGGSSGYTVSSQNSARIGYGTWHHTALTMSVDRLLAIATLSLYVDYGLADQITFPFPAGDHLQFGNAPFRIASSFFGDQDLGIYRHHFVGLLDEIRLCDVALSPTQFLQAHFPAAIVSPPANQTVIAGSTAALTVGATGTLPLTYQWRKEGVNLDGATNATLILINAQLPHAGNYDVVVANAYGSVTSSAAQLTVNLILSQPTHQTVLAGGTAAFTVGAAKTLPPTYQWRKEGVDLIGVTNATLTLTNVQLPDAGNYDVVVANAYSRATSSVARLTVNVIAAQPESHGIPMGSNTVFSIQIGSLLPPVSFQWLFNGAKLSDSGRIGGTATELLTISGVEFSDAGGYSVVVSNVSGVATSAVARLLIETCVTPPSGLVAWWRGEGNGLDSALDRAGGYLTNGTSFVPGKVGQAFRFERAGTNNPYFAASATNLPAGTSDRTIELWVKLDPSTDVRRVLLLAGYVDNDSNARYVLYSQWNALRFSAGGDTLSGGTIQFGKWHHVAVTSARNLATLYVDGESVASGGVRITTSSRYFWLGTATGFSGSQGIEVDEVGIYNRALEAAEIAALYAAGGAGKCPNALFVSIPPSSQRVLPGSNVTFSAQLGTLPSAAGYQWQFNGTNLLDGGRISGANSDSLTITNVQVGDAGAYRVVASHPAGTVTSSEAQLRVDVCTAPPLGLIAWWPFEGSAEDRVSTNAGTVVRTARFMPGFIGQALSFSNWNDGVSVADAPVLRPATITAEAWVKGGPQDTYACLFGKLNRPDASYGMYTGEKGGLAFYVTTRTGTVYSPEANAGLWDDHYHHITGTYDGSFVRLYVDGVEVGQGTPCHGPIRYSSTEQNGILVFGCDPNRRWYDAMIGELDELCLYNRALSSNEIVTLYAAGLAGECPGVPLISAQLADQFVVHGNTATFMVQTRGEPPLSYQWLFNGTNLANGGRISGATAAVLTLTEVQSGDAGLYSVIVSNASGWTASTATLYVDLIPIITDTVIDAANMSFDGQNLLVNGCTLTVNGRHSFNSLALVKQSLLTHSPALAGETNNRLELTITQDMSIEANSWVDASGLGYGAQSGPGAGRSAADESEVGYGAGYGGRGGGNGGGPTYGSVTEPLDMGSGGGGNPWSGDGGAGGGAIRLTVNGTLRLNGNIQANGINGNGDAGGGSGGSVLVIAGVVTGNGSVSANGGAGATGGGGGRIAFHLSGASDLPRAHLHAEGGAPLGQPGTVVINTSPLFVWTATPGDHAYGTVTLAWTARLAVNLDAVHAQLVAYHDGAAFTIATGAPAMGSAAWNTTAVPDGEYVVKAVFSSPAGNALGELSARTVVNNSAVWHSGIIATNTVWSNNAVQVVQGNLAISGGAILTIRPGTVVKFVRGARITLANDAVLNALGTPDAMIIFTSLADDTAGGDTNLDGKQSRPLPGDWTLAVEGGGQLVSNEFFERRYTSVAFSGTLAGDTTAPGLLLYQVPDDVTVPAGATVTIQPGAVVKFAAGKGLTVLGGGRLVAEGTVAQPIIFTSIKDDAVGGDANSDGDASVPAAGDWRSIRLESGATGSLRHVEVRYGGSADGMVACNGGTWVIDGCVFSKSMTDGIRAGGTVTLTNSVITGADRGVVAEGEVTAVNCTFLENRQGVVEHNGTLAVRNSLVIGSADVGVLHDSGTDRVTVTFSDVWNPAGANYRGTTDKTGQNGNLSANPLFKNAAKGDYRLNYRSPAIDAADGVTAPPADFMGAPRYDDPRTPNTGVATASGVYADMGAFEFVETAASEVDLVAVAVDGPTMVVAGDNATVQWLLVNLGSGEAVGPWHDTISLAPSAGATNSLWTAEALVGEGLVLGPGESYWASAAVRVPGAIESSNYLWQVHVNSRGEVFEGAEWTNNITTADTRSSLTVPALTVGGPAIAGQFDSIAPSHWFKFVSPSNLDVSVSLTLAGSGTSELYLGQGYMPTRQHYDFRQAQWNASQAAILAPAAPGQTYYLLAYAPSLPAGSAGFTVGTLAKGFELRSVSPGEAGNVGCVTLQIQGSGLQPGDAFELAPSVGAPIPAIVNRLTNSTLAYATFDLTGASTGVWDLRARRGEVTATLTQGLTVTAGGGPNFYVDFVGRSLIREGRSYRYEIVYGNRGNVDAFGAIVLIAGIPRQASVKLGPEFTTVPIPAGSLDPGLAQGELTLNPLVIPHLRPGESGTASLSLSVSGSPDFHITPYVLGPTRIDARLYASGLPSKLQAAGLLRLQNVLPASDCAIPPVDQAALNIIYQECYNEWMYGTSSFPYWFWNKACVGEAEHMQTVYMQTVTGNATLTGWTFQRISKNGVVAGHTTVLGTSPSGHQYIIDNYVSPTIIPLETAGKNEWVVDQSCLNTVSGWTSPFLWLEDIIMATKPDSTVTWTPYQGPEVTAGANCCVDPDPVPPVPIEIVVSHDPNVKLGPVGVGAGEFIAGLEPLLYRIDFENQASASAAAQEVRITDALSTNLDWSTFELKPIGFNGVVIDVPAGLQTFTTTTNVTSNPSPVRVTAALDPATGIVTWQMMSIDPVTGELVEDPLAGFLPPNDATQRGEGFVSYSVYPKNGLTTGTEILNQASIVFDVNAPIPTDIVTNTIDAGAPISRVLPLPVIVLTNFVVQWTGQDDAKGSGMAGCDIYVSDNSGPWVLWQDWWNSGTNTSAVFTGQPGHIYSFYSLAHDGVGLREVKAPVAEATTIVSTNRPPVIEQVLPSFVIVGKLLVITNLAVDPDGITFSLDTSAPAGATITSNGLFKWRPVCVQGSTTNPITVWATDNGYPPMSNSLTFMVAASECVEVGIGQAVVPAGQTSSVPLQLISTVGLTNLSFTLLSSSERLTNWSISTLDPAIDAAIVTTPEAGQTRFSITARPGQLLRGPVLFGELGFATLPGSSAFVPLNIADIEGLKSNGTPVGNNFGTPGRVVLVGDEPLLDAVLASPSQPAVILYALPGSTNVLEATPGLSPPTWNTYQQVIMTSLWQVLEPRATNQSQFFRARKF